MNMATIEINNLTKQFGNVWAVKNISLILVKVNNRSSWTNGSGKLPPWV